MYTNLYQKCIQIYLHKNVHHDVIYNSKKLEST